MISKSSAACSSWASSGFLISRSAATVLRCYNTAPAIVPRRYARYYITHFFVLFLFFFCAHLICGCSKKRKRKEKNMLRIYHIFASFWVLLCLTNGDGCDRVCTYSLCVSLLFLNYVVFDIKII
jgi:hypothetical membrane protein